MKLHLIHKTFVWIIVSFVLVLICCKNPRFLIDLILQNLHVRFIGMYQKIVHSFRKLLYSQQKMRVIRKSLGINFFFRYTFQFHLIPFFIVTMYGSNSLIPWFILTVILIYCLFCVYILNVGWRRLTCIRRDTFSTFIF